MRQCWRKLSRQQLDFIFFGDFPAFEAHLSRCSSSFVEDQAVHVVGQIGQRDLGRGALEADGADEQPHLVLLLGEDMFDAGSNPGFDRVGLGGPLWHRLASWLPAMDAADPALSPEPFLVGLAAIGGVRPDVRGSVVVCHDVPEHPPVEARRVGGLALADEAEGPTDRDAALVAEARDRDVDPRFAIGHGPGLGELQRPARIRILLRGPGRLIRPDRAGLLARLDRILLSLGVALLGSGHQRRIDDLPPSADLSTGFAGGTFGQLRPWQDSPAP